MGQVITRIAHYREDVKITAGFDINPSVSNDFPVFTSLQKCNVAVDVIVDFSHPSALRIYWIMQFHDKNTACYCYYRNI